MGKVCDGTRDLVTFSIENLFVNQKVIKEVEKVFWMAVPGKDDCTDLDCNSLALMLFIYVKACIWDTCYYTTYCCCGGLFVTRKCWLLRKCCSIL
jgi:hypothetical protein